MTIIAQTDCCTLLGIDPKTLRNWLRHAQMQFAAHPLDARLKCLTEEQVQQLATLHARPLLSPATACPAPMSVAPPSALAQEQACPRQKSEARPVQAANPLSSPLAQEADFVKKLSCLETKVTTLQEQLAQLALELLQERSLRYERRLNALEALLPQRLDASASQQDLPATVAAGQAESTSMQGRPLHPAELRARSRVVPLIEYGAQGTYVVICPQEGELLLTPDSPQWFAWLATLSSFRFVGQQGRFSAYRKGRMSRRWSAYRTIHQHDYQYYLGTTDHLTIACLEQMAAKLQSHMPSL